MRYAEVVVDLSADALDRRFTYILPDTLQAELGWQVEVPFGPRSLEGFIVAIKDECDLPPDKLKPVKRAVRDYAVILPELISLSEWIHERYLCNFVDALRLMLPAQMRGDRVHVKCVRMAVRVWNDTQVNIFREANRRAKTQIEILEKLSNGPVETASLPASALKALTDKGAVKIVGEETRRTPSILTQSARAAEPELMRGQKRAVEEITESLQNDGGRFLLNGVTGSGKTEVYIRVVRKAVEMGKTAIVLVPEISLTPQMVAWFHARFGADAAVLHSGLSIGERYDEWRRIRFGEARVVIGARSAIFAPMENIGVIIVDEEHETSYLSDRRPRYDAREVAWQRALNHGAALVLGSATPSISSFMRCMPNVKSENKLTLIELPERVMGRPLPTVELVDMRDELNKGNKSIFSAKLSVALRECLENGKQAVLFLNRRGFSSYVNCRSCGKSIKCSQCDVTMTYHKFSNRLVCHYCGNEMTPPKICPECQSRFIRYVGIGTEQVEEEVRLQFPIAKTVRMDNDTTRGKDAHERLLDIFRSGRANVLIGTQMIAKGLDFPKVTLVGVISADLTLNMPDYRASERTFQLLTQVAGRAGRAEDAGHVIIQTYDPEHYAIQHAVTQNYRAFYMQESRFRRESLYPPFTRIARLVFSADDMESAMKAAQDAEKRLNAWIDENAARGDIVQMRALEAPINQLRGKFRWQVFMKMFFKGDFDGITREMRAIEEDPPEKIRIELEIDPVNMI